MWTFSSKVACHRYNILDMEEDGNTPEHKFYGVEFQNLPTDYHTWGYLVFVLEDPLQGGPTGLPKWETRARTSVYIGHYPFHAGSVALVLNTRTRHVSPQYYVVFGNTLYTVEHMSKGTFPRNLEKLI